MTSFTSKSLSVHQLFDWFDDCRFAVPEIQREFVWNTRQVCSLLDSIYKGYPVGSAMVWKTSHKNNNLLRQRLHVLPPFDATRHKQVHFLIDGQQRLSVLHRIRLGESVSNSNKQAVAFDLLCFEINDGDTAFVAPKRPDPKIHFPVRHILAANWFRHFKGIPEYKRKKIVECRLRILNYKLPFIFLDSNDLSDVRETFIRINTQGMKMSEADRAFSVASKVRPLHLYRQLCAHLPPGFQGLEKNTYWMSLTLLRGFNALGQKAITRLTREIEGSEEGRIWFERHEPKAAECIRLACDYLSSQFGVTDLKSLPYEAMISVLAHFFHFNNRAQPKTLQRQQIRAWFWHTAVVKRYAGSGYSRNILADSEYFERLGQTKKGRYAITERASRNALVNEDYRGASALSRAFRLMLAARKPAYLDNGEPISLGQTASKRNSKELHHIWPRALLTRHGIPAKRFNTLCNICFLAASDNRSFGSKHPLSYLEDYWSRRHFARTMRSHFIPYKNDSPLWDANVSRGFKAFIDARRKLIEHAFNTAAGAKLFES